MSVDSVGIHLGPLFIHFYGIIIVAGAFCAGYLASLEAQRRGLNPDHVWDAMIWALVGGIIGARLWHIFTPPPSMVAAGWDTAYYLNITHTTPVNIPILNIQIPVPVAVAPWLGGLGIPGAVIGGLIALWLYCRGAKLDFVQWVDIVAPALPLGQAIGRWGNYVNQELYGRPTTLPWSITIDAAHRVSGFTDPTLKFHPTFLYESIGNLLICLALLYLGRRFADWLKRAALFFFCLVGYPTLRFLLEFIRLDSAQTLGLNTNQTLMAVLVIIAFGVLFSRHRRLRRYELRPESAG